MLIAACIALIAGCSSSSEPDATDAVDDTVVTGATAAPGGELAGAGAAGLATSSLARWGTGRATLARYDAVGTRTAVVTTVQLSLYGDDGTVSRIGGDFTERFSRTALSADGTLLALAGDFSGSVTVWDLTSGQAVGAPFTADGPVSRLEFLPSGAAVVVSTAASTTSVPVDGSTPSVLAGASQGPLGPAAIAPDGSWIVVPVDSVDGARVAMSRAEGSTFVDLTGVDGLSAWDAVPSPSGRYVGVVTASRADPFESLVAIWDVASGTLAGTIPLVDSGGQSRWAFGPDDRVLAADGPATTLWSPSGEQLLTIDVPAETPVQSVFPIGVGRGFVTTLQDGTIDVWDPDGNRLMTLGEPGTTLVDVAVAPDGNSVTAVDFFGVVRRWDIAAAPSSTAPVEVVDGVGLINSVAFAPDGSGFAVATSTGLVETIDDAGVLVRAFEQPKGNVDSVAFSPDSTTVASAMGERRGPESFDDTVTIFDAQSGGAAARFGGEAEQVAGCAFFRNEVRFSPDGELMAANSHDFTVSLYDASDGTILHTFAPHGSTVTDLAFSPKGDLLATTSDDSTLRVWSVADHQLVKEYTAPAGGYWSLVFGGEGSLVVSDLVGTVSVLDLDTGSVLRTFAGLKDRLAELAISPDGSLVASGGEDNSVELWSASTGEIVAQLPGHTAPVRTVAFSSDGTKLASGSSDGTVRLWGLGS